MCVKVVSPLRKGVSGTRVSSHTLSFTPLDATMNSETQYEDSVSIMVLENIKNKLRHAFRTTAEPRGSSENDDDPTSTGRSFQANEELRRAKIDGAITWLRSELVSRFHCIVTKFCVQLRCNCLLEIRNVDICEQQKSFPNNHVT